jgi:hypothetical protein
MRMSEILVIRNGKQVGPYTRTDASRYLASGHLNPGDPSWATGHGIWRPLSELLKIEHDKERSRFGVRIAIWGMVLNFIGIIAMFNRGRDAVIISGLFQLFGQILFLGGTVRALLIINRRSLDYAHRNELSEGVEQKREN